GSECVGSQYSPGKTGDDRPHDQPRAESQPASRAEEVEEQKRGEQFDRRGEPDRRPSPNLSVVSIRHPGENEQRQQDGIQLSLEYVEVQGREEKSEGDRR